MRQAIVLLNDTFSSELRWAHPDSVDRKDPKLGYTVRITPPDSPGSAATSFEALTPPGKPPESHLQMHRAVRTSIEAIPDRPNQSVNPVVMPGEVIGEPGILVYLLAGTNKDNVVVFGKHYRVLVSRDGQRAIRVEPLTKTALEIQSRPLEQEGSKPAGLFVSHVLGDYPLETHMFISLLHHTDVYVAAGKYIWRIHEDKIILVSRKNAE